MECALNPDIKRNSTPFFQAGSNLSATPQTLPNGNPTESLISVKEENQK